MWELHTVSINFNNLNNIWMCCTHHVQTYLEEKGRNVTVHSDASLTSSAPPSPPSLQHTRARALPAVLSASHTQCKVIKK